MNEVGYIINTPDCQKEKRLCHVNMLKLYYDKCQEEVPLATAVHCVSSIDTHLDEQPQELEEVGKSPRLRNSDVLLDLEKLSHLPEQEKVSIKSLLMEFVVLFPDVPGKTTLTSHDVDTGDALPIKQHLYRINPVKLIHMRNEVECLQ